MKQVQQEIDLVNNENSDLILFTGNLIAVHAEEQIYSFREHIYLQIIYILSFSSQ